MGTSLLRNLLTGKGVKQPKFCNIYRQGFLRAGEGTIRAGKDAIIAVKGF